MMTSTRTLFFSFFQKIQGALLSLHTTTKKGIVIIHHHTHILPPLLACSMMTSEGETFGSVIFFSIFLEKRPSHTIMGNEQSNDETRSLWIRETEWDEKHRGMIANAIKEALMQLDVVGGSQTTVCTYSF